MRIAFCLALALGPVFAQDAKVAPPLVVIRELDANRGATVKRELEAAFTKAGFKVALLTQALADDAAVGDWFAERAKEDDFDTSRVLVFGFSAAGVEAAKLALAHPKRFAGLVLAAALVPVPPDADLKAAAPHLPVYLVYGGSDTTAPAKIGEAGRKTFEAAGVGCDWMLLPKADHFDVLKSGGASMAEWSGVAGFCVSRLRQSDAFAAEGKKAEARKLLEEIQKAHPKSKFAEQAKKRVAALK